MKRIDGTLKDCYATKHDLPPVGERASTDADAALDRWILHLPGHHPDWDDYMLAGCTLADLPGIEPAVITVKGATHEIFVGAIDPVYPLKLLKKGGVKLLHPLNYALQFAAKDDAAANAMLEAIAIEFINGNLVAEPDGIRGARKLFAETVNRILEEQNANDSK